MLPLRLLYHRRAGLAGSTTLMKKVRAPYSLVVLFVLFVMMVQARLWAPRWDTHNVLAILSWDVMGYYLYLPAQFIYHDLSHLAFIPDILHTYNPTASFYQAFQVPGAPANTFVMKYPCGLAVLLTPFFWLGHWAAAAWHYPQDGFSAPYQVAIAFGGLLYALLGLGVLRRVLLHFASDAVTTIVLLVLVLGTNYLQYSIFDAAMPHNFLFTLYALLLLGTLHWHARPRRWLAAAIGLLLGLLVLCRPSEAVAVLLPVLWGVGSVAALRAKVALLRSRWPDVALLVLFGVIGILPQLLYWKWATGHFIVYSYEEQGFSFLRPHTWQVLFSFRKGWLIYTPLMLLPLAGLVVLWRQNRGVAVPVLAYFLLNLWVVSAWDIWWYGGSIGQRALVQSYAALSIPFAYLLGWALAPARRTAFVGLALAAAMLLLVDLNLFQHWQYMQAIIHAEDMNRPYYWAVFNKVSPTQDDYSVLDTGKRLPKPLDRYDRKMLGELDFNEQPVAAETGISADRGYFSAQSYRSDAARNYSPTLTIPLTAENLLRGSWLRASVQVFADYGAWGNKLVLSVERDGKAIEWEQIRLQNPGSVDGRWNQFWLDAPLTDEARPGDVLKVFVLNEQGSGCYLDDLQVEQLTLKTGWLAVE